MSLSLVPSSPMIGSWADQPVDDHKAKLAAADAAAAEQQKAAAAVMTAQKTSPPQDGEQPSQPPSSDAAASSASAATAAAATDNDAVETAAPEPQYHAYFIDPNAPMSAAFLASLPPPPSNAAPSSGPAGGWGTSGKLKEMARAIFERAYGLNGRSRELHEPLCEEVMRDTACSRKSFCELVYGHSYAAELTDLRAMVPDYRPKERRKRDASERGRGGRKKTDADEEEAKVNGGRPSSLPHHHVYQNGAVPPQVVPVAINNAANLHTFLSRGTGVPLGVHSHALGSQPVTSLHYYSAQPVQQNPIIHLTHRLIPSVHHTPQHQAALQALQLQHLQQQQQQHGALPMQPLGSDSSLTAPLQPMSGRFAPPPPTARSPSPQLRPYGTGSNSLQASPTLGPAVVGQRRSIDATNALIAAVAAAHSVSPHLSSLGDPSKNPPLMIPSSPNLAPISGAALKNSSSAKVVGSPLRQSLSHPTGGAQGQGQGAALGSGANLPPRASASPSLNPLRGLTHPPGFSFPSPSLSAQSSPLHMPVRATPPPTTAAAAPPFHSPPAAMPAPFSFTVTAAPPATALIAVDSSPAASAASATTAATATAATSAPTPAAATPVVATPSAPLSKKAAAAAAAAAEAAEVERLQREREERVEQEEAAAAIAAVAASEAAAAAALTMGKPKKRAPSLPSTPEEADSSSPTASSFALSGEAAAAEEELTPAEKKARKKARAKLKKEARKSEDAAAAAAATAAAAEEAKRAASLRQRKTSQKLSSPPAVGAPPAPARIATPSAAEALSPGVSSVTSLGQLFLMTVIGSALFMVTRTYFGTVIYEGSAADLTVQAWSCIAVFYLSSLFLFLWLFRRAHDAHQVWTALVLELSNQLDKYVVGWELLAVDDPDQALAAINQIQTLLNAALASFTGLSSIADKTHAVEALEHAVQTMDFLHLAHRNLISELGSTQPIMRLVASLGVVRQKIMVVRSHLVTNGVSAAAAAAEDKSAPTTRGGISPLGLLLLTIFAVNSLSLLFSPPLASLLLNHALPLGLLSILSVLMLVVWGAQYPFSAAQASRAFPASLLTLFGATLLVSLEPLHYLRTRLTEKAAETAERVAERLENPHLHHSLDEATEDQEDDDEESFDVEEETD